jgi:hypothetical protein
MKNSYAYTEVECYLTDCEYLAFKIKSGSNYINVCAIYRPPQADVNNFIVSLNELLFSLTLMPYECILCGDMNINTMDNNNIKVTEYLDMLSSYGLTCNKLLPTRRTTNSETCIDHVCAAETIIERIMIIPIDISDHDVLLCVVNSHSNIDAITDLNIPPISKRVNYPKLRNSLQEHWWSDLYALNQVNACVALFMGVLDLKITAASH